ncbi:MAG: ChbG/HpnK family deacetylase [Myxococcaceae bacterium]|nr:ChbG/HpnK family deacetylase [Myxococcaceae bacterium]
MTFARVILNADDLGYEPSVSLGIVEAMVQGIVSSTTLMVNTPYVDEAFSGARKYGLAVGLHFNLARYVPLSTAPVRLLTQHGELDERKVTQWSTEEVEAELNAQLEAFEKGMKRPPTHIDVHKHLHSHVNVFVAVVNVARRRDFPVRSINAEMRAQFRQQNVKTNDAFEGEAGDEPGWTLEKLEARLKALPENGVVEWMCHPGYEPKQFTSSYGKQREIERALFVSKQARALLDKYGVQLCSWAEAFNERL